MRKLTYKILYEEYSKIRKDMGDYIYSYRLWKKWFIKDKTMTLMKSLEMWKKKNIDYVTYWKEYYQKNKEKMRKYHREYKKEKKEAKESLQARINRKRKLEKESLIQQKANESQSKNFIYNIPVSQ